jgi:hypothetical protein
LICDSPEDGASEFGIGGRVEAGPVRPRDRAVRVERPGNGSDVCGQVLRRGQGRGPGDAFERGTWCVSDRSRGPGAAVHSMGPGGRPGDTLIGALERGGGRCPGGRCAPRLRRPEKLRLGARTVECPVGWCLSPL